MIFNIKWAEKKNNDWIVATLIEGASNGQPTEYSDVSINRIDKKTGQVSFPKFDDIQSGRDIEGEIWRSPKGVWYLFAPRAKSQDGAYKRSGGGNTAAIKEAQDTKAKNIAQAQDRSAWMWAKNNASTLLAARGYSDITPMESMANQVIELATKIYNGEPTEPFN